jgi:hypothetical protein
MSGGLLLARQPTPPGAAGRGSEARLIGLSEFGELRVDELLGVELCGISSPIVPLLPEFFASSLT